MMLRAADAAADALDHAAQDAAVLANLREMAEEHHTMHGLEKRHRRIGLRLWLSEAKRTAAQAVTPPEAPDA
jgi:hypothetical protein